MRPLTLAVALAAAAPIWITHRLPIEDYPLHLATLRVLSDYASFQDDFVITLGRSQYVGFYALGRALAPLLGVEGALRALVSLELGGTLVALAALLAALGKDERACLFAVPLIYGPLFALGLFPFLLAVPLLLAIVALAARKPTRASTVTLALSSIALATWHLVPFGVAVLGALLVGRRRALVALAPGVLTSALWLALTDAGKQVRDTLSAPGHRLKPAEALLDAYDWVGNSFHDRSDELLFGAFLALALVCARPRRLARPLYALLPLACALSYLVLGRDHGFIWPIAQRFPMLATLLAIPLLTFPRGAARVVRGALAALSLAVIVNVSVHFVRFEREEVGAFDEALARLPPRAHVAALIFDRDSRIVRWSPFLHYGSLYQAERAGVVMFTFAGYNHWPLDFRPGRCPPPGTPARPRWEWTPERVDGERDLVPYFDFVLTRGEGFSSRCWERTFTKSHWSIFERRC